VQFDNCGKVVIMLSVELAIGGLKFVFVLPVAVELAVASIATELAGIAFC
jgi:hypothetical protein